MMESIYKPGYKIQGYASTQNTFGGSSKSFTTLATISGYLRELRGDEVLAADRKEVDSSHRFYCDPSSIAINETNRLVDPDNNIYDIRFSVHKNTGGISFIQANVRFTGEVAT